MRNQPIIGIHRLLARPVNAPPDAPFIDLGEVSAFKITLSNGQTAYSGKPEAIFDLRLDDEDKEMLAGMKIGRK